MICIACFHFFRRCFASRRFFSNPFIRRRFFCNPFFRRRFFCNPFFRRRFGGFAIRRASKLSAFWTLSQSLLDKLHQLLEIDIPISEEYRIIRPVKLLREPQRILRLESPNLLGCAQDIVPQRRTLEEDILELIVNQFGRRIVIALYLIADNLHLLIYLRLWINRVEDDVGKQVHGPCDVLLQDGGVIHRALLVGVGIQVAAHTLQTVEYVPGFSAFGALEGDVLAEVSQALLARLLVAGTGVYLIAAIHHLAI